MREDMYKVIVERPRRGGNYRGEKPAPQDLDDSPKQEGLKRRHRDRKWLNENLRPLERYLAAQVGRPWDKVYSEICAGVDRRNTVQQHIHQHLEDFVAMKVSLIEGRPHRHRAGRGPEPLDSRWGPKFYVDPRSGILRENRWRTIARAQARDAHRRIMSARRSNLRDDVRIIGSDHQLHCIDGIWYRVTLAKVDKSVPQDAICRLRGIAAHLCPDICDAGRTRCNLNLFGRPDVYASDKRQLSAHELRAHRLVNRVH